MGAPPPGSYPPPPGAPGAPPSGSGPPPGSSPSSDLPPPPHAAWPPPPPPPGQRPPPPPGSGPGQSGDGKKWVFAVIVIVLLAIAAFIAFRVLAPGEEPQDPASPAATAPSDDVTEAATASEAEPPTATPTEAAAGPTEPAQPTDTPATAAPTPADTEAPDKADRVTALHSSLDELAVDEVVGYQLRDREVSPYIEELGGEGERLEYRRDGRVHFQINGLFTDSDIAMGALEQRYQLLVEENGYEVEFDEPLRDTDGGVLGRILSVLTEDGQRIVSWTNSNLLVTIGPERPRLMQRWYEALPY